MTRDSVQDEPGVKHDGAVKQCTDKICEGEARFALWMGDQFSRVVDAHESMSYDSGDLHPHVCESCLPRYKDLHGDKGEFIRPNERLVTDGGANDGEVKRTVAVDDELEEAVHWVERELREARQALWDGKSGKAFASIEAAQDEFETVEEAILDD